MTCLMLPILRPQLWLLDLSVAQPRHPGVLMYIYLLPVLDERIAQPEATVGLAKRTLA